MDGRHNEVESQKCARLNYSSVISFCVRRICNYVTSRVDERSMHLSTVQCGLILSFLIWTTGHIQRKWWFYCSREQRWQRWADNVVWGKKNTLRIWRILYPLKCVVFFSVFCLLVSANMKIGVTISSRYTANQHTTRIVFTH